MIMQVLKRFDCDLICLDSDVHGCIFKIFLVGLQLDLFSKVL